MKLGESLFDVAYLVIVVALGFRLLLEKKQGAKLFGIMAVLLGLGDSFHLVPRIISHLSPGGFEAHTAALSWGQLVTSITMTIFYVLYFHFYQRQSNDFDRKKKLLVYLLAVIRIILVLLPQNNWGTAEGNYLFGIYRNLPFLILGVFLIYWSYQQKNQPGLKQMALLIFLSFLFYVPVVLLSDSIPAIGALMLPKTIAYLMIVILGYRYFIGQLTAHHLLGTSFTFLVMGLMGGLFYREFTRFYQFTLDTHLSKLHVHTLVLGFILLLILFLVTRRYDSELMKTLKQPIYTYLTGLVFTLITMTLIGIYQVVSEGQAIVSQSALNGMSGLGHIILTIGLVQLIYKIYQIESEQSVEI